MLVAAEARGKEKRAQVEHVKNVEGEQGKSLRKHRRETSGEQETEKDLPEIKRGGGPEKVHGKNKEFQGGMFSIVSHVQVSILSSSPVIGLICLHLQRFYLQIGVTFIGT